MFSNSTLFCIFRNFVMQPVYQSFELSSMDLGPVKPLIHLVFNSVLYKCPTDLYWRLSSSMPLHRTSLPEVHVYDSVLLCVKLVYTEIPYFIVVVPVKKSWWG